MAQLQHTQPRKVIAMMETHQIIAALRPYKLKTVAADIGVHRATLYRLVNEQTKPSPMLQKQLSEYLQGKDSDYDQEKAPI